MRVSLFGLFFQCTSFVWLEAGEYKHSGVTQSPRYYPNTTFAYVCVYCSSRDNTDYVCLAYNCMGHIVYTRGFLYFDYPLDILVSCDQKPSIHTLVSLIYLISVEFILALITFIMLHLTFNSSCSIICLCAYHPFFPHQTCVCTPGNFLYQAQNTNADVRAPSMGGSIPTQSPYSAAGIPPQSPKFTTPMMGQILTRKQP